MEDKGGDCLGSMGDRFRYNLKEIVPNEICHRKALFVGTITLSFTSACCWTFSHPSTLLKIQMWLQTKKFL
jgi:hypothetical protein